MFKKVLIPENASFYLPSFFLPKNEIDEKQGFSGGKIISITGEQYEVDSTVKDKGDDGEFFLNIRFKPLSPEIREVKIVNDKELKEIRNKSDDLLNIFIPVGRYNNFGQIYDGGYINQELLLTKKGRERRMSGFFDEGRVHLAGFLARAPSGEIIDLFKNQNVQMEEGDFLFLDFSGAVVYNKNTNREDFYLDSFGLNKGQSGSSRISTSFYTENNGVNGERSSGSFPLSFRYPIGQVVNSNFLTFARGSVRIMLNKDSLTYFLKTQSIDGCNYSVYETKTTYSVYPSFE